VGNFIYKIEYNNDYSEKAERIMLQVAKNIGIEYLYNDEGYSDYISLSNIPEVTNTKIEKNNKSLYYIKINKMYINKKLDKTKIIEILHEVPLYYLLSFLGYAYYRYKRNKDIIDNIEDKK
jgi:hypothetical protein